MGTWLDPGQWHCRISTGAGQRHFHSWENRGSKNVSIPLVGAVHGSGAQNCCPYFAAGLRMRPTPQGGQSSLRQWIMLMMKSVLPLGPISAKTSTVQRDHLRGLGAECYSILWERQIRRVFPRHAKSGTWSLTVLVPFPWKVKGSQISCVQLYLP